MNDNLEHHNRPRRPSLREIRVSESFKKSKEAYSKMNLDIFVAKKKLREKDLAEIESNRVDLK
jgi:hypothetical protein